MSEVRKTVNRMLDKYGREESIKLAMEFAEVDKANGTSPDFWYQVHDMLQLAVFSIKNVGANKFKVVWHVPPSEASLRVVK